MRLAAGGVEDVVADGDVAGPDQQADLHIGSGEEDVAFDDKVACALVGGIARWTQAHGPVGVANEQIVADKHPLRILVRAHAAAVENRRM